MTRFFPDISISLTVNKIPDMFQITWHFQVFQTSGHPEFNLAYKNFLQQSTEDIEDLASHMSNSETIKPY